MDVVTGIFFNLPFLMLGVALLSRKLSSNFEIFCRFNLFPVILRQIRVQIRSETVMYSAGFGSAKSKMDLDLFRFPN